MAKIRFPLIMKDGTAVRRIEELRGHFDLESVLGYFADGKLKIWLENNYYEEEAQKVSCLSADMPNLSEKICEIFGVEYSAKGESVDFDKVQRRQEKLRILREITDDQQILDSVDAVAFDQNELFEILNNPPVRVYLFGDKFIIPFEKKNISYAGINNPLILLENGRFLSEYKNNDVTFQNVQYETGIHLYAIRGETEFLHGDLQAAFELIKENALRDHPRAMYLMACFYDQGYGVVKLDHDERNEWCTKALHHHEPLSTYGYAKWCVPKGEDHTSLYQGIADEIRKMAEADDALAQGVFAEMLRSGLGILRDVEQSVVFYMKAAEKGNARSQYSLGLMYKMGIGVERDPESATACFEVAADKKHYLAMQELKKTDALVDLSTPVKEIGVNHDTEWEFEIGEELFISREYNKAFPIIEDAAKKGNPRAMFFMALYYNEGFNTVKCNMNTRNEWCEKALPYNEPLSMFGYTTWCLYKRPNDYRFRGVAYYPYFFHELQDQQIQNYQNIYDSLVKLANAGDSFAQSILGVITLMGIIDNTTFNEHFASGLSESCYQKALLLIKKALEKNNVLAQSIMFRMKHKFRYTDESYLTYVPPQTALTNIASVQYEQGDRQFDFDFNSNKYLLDAAKQEYAPALYRLSGCSIPRTDKIELLKRAAKLGFGDAKIDLMEMRVYI